jgi:sigma-B regulation protein RsbU (phosphoserine phosphatase)
MKLFVADDDADSRNLLAELLTKWGHEVTSAADGREAWEILAGPDAPHLVILDWVMPGIDGVTLCRQLREKDARNPFYIILLTSKNQPQDTVSALEAGANDFITKPYDFDELRARVDVGCRVLDLQRQLRNQERLRGVLQMAGAVCHDMNQPLERVAASVQFLLDNLPREHPCYEAALRIQMDARSLGDVTRRIMNITKAPRPRKPER